jgi:LysM repeat protein
MAVTTEDGQRFSLYSSPSKFEFGEVARFGSIDREGMKPITRNLGDGLKTLSFTHTIGSLDYQQSIEHVVEPLTRLAREGKKVRFVGGSPGYEQGVWWNIKSLPVSVPQRASDNRASRVQLSWSLEEAVDVTANIVRVIPAPPPPAPAPAAVRQHRVVPGDTLWDIARKYLGNGIRWPEIFNLNASQIRNPHWIYPGQVFKIPA